jgi:predicted phosphodiesterase
MRIALISDIHGNLITLEAVLKDIEVNGGVDGYWVLGDLAALGYDPVGTLERLSKLPNAEFVRGNTDKYIVTGERPLPPVEAIKDDFSLVYRFLTITASFAWTAGAVTTAGWFDWLQKLPLEFRTVLPDGTRFLGVHAAPGTDDGPGINPSLDNNQIRSVLAKSNADLVCVAHTHHPMDVTINGTRLVNLGSVSNPFPPDLRASYVLLEADHEGYKLEHRYVDYDHQAVIDALKHVHHPAAEYISNYQVGKNLPGWQGK